MNSEVLTMERQKITGAIPQLRQPLNFIFLYGPPGAGKSAVAPRLAKALGMPWLDLDDEIERQSGMSIPEIFSQSGEAAFRQLERETLQHALSGAPSVVALGGGALLDPYNRQSAEASGRVVCLFAPSNVLLNRMQADHQRRPLLHQPGECQAELPIRLTQLLDNRRDHYNSFPVQVNTAQGSPARLSSQIQMRLGRYYVRSTGRVNPHGYPIIVQAGGLADLGTGLQQLGLHGPVAVVADTNVSGLYGETVLEILRQSGFEASVIPFPAGEAHKTLETLACLYHGFSALKLDRLSTVVALGGGITSDLAGFAASTYLRGLNWVTVPTSLLAMADASIGGKTGVDLPQGKNLAGSFYSPRLVLADPGTLETLPRRELIAGLAEVVKAGLIADPGLFNLCCQGWPVDREKLSELLCRSIAVKVNLVQSDPFERGRRSALNLGHTLGHAIEVVSEYRLLHGEAVAIGLVLEAHLSEHLGLAHLDLADKIEACLLGLGLPVKIPAGLSRIELVEAMSFDKKRLDGTLRFTLPIYPGRVRVGVQVDDWANTILQWS